MRWRAAFVLFAALAACEAFKADPDLGTNDGGDGADGSTDDSGTSADGAPLGDGSAGSDGGGGGGGDSGPSGPVVIVQGQMHPYDIAVEGDTLYFTLRGDQDASVKRVKIDGGGLTTLAPFDINAGLNPNSADLELVGNDVVWVNETASVGAIFKVPKAGGAFTPVQSNLDTPHALGSMGTMIAWTDQRFSPVVYPLMRSDPPNGTAQAAAKAQIRVGGIAIDNSGIYWTEGGALANGHAAVHKQKLDAGADAAPADIWGISVPETMGNLALGANDVYFAETEGARILSVPKTGGNATVLANGQDVRDARRVAFDGSYVYYTEYGLGTASDGAVMKVPLDGGAPRPVATNQDHPFAIAVDATYVYWANYPKGEILRATK